MSEYKLTARENLIEVMKGGKPERFVKQYEAFDISGTWRPTAGATTRARARSTRSTTGASRCRGPRASPARSRTTAPT